MNWKQYQNELIVLASLLLLVMAIIFKNVRVSSAIESSHNISRSLNELKEIVDLKKRWADKTTNKKVDKLKSVVSSSKLKWIKKTKKLTAIYTNLNSKELNKVVTTLLNLTVQIDKLEIKQTGTTYGVELKCKW
jgi:hypothetical protein